MTIDGMFSEYLEVWFCQKCRKVGHLKPVEERASPLEAVGLCNADHEINSPKCKGSRIEFTVVARESDLSLKVPDWARSQVEELLSTL